MNGRHAIYWYFCTPTAATTIPLLTAWSGVHLEKLTCSQLVKKFPAFYGTRTFITVFTSTRHLPLFWARSIQSMRHHPSSWRSNLTVSFHLRVVFLGGLFPSGFPNKILQASLLSPIRATYIAHFILVNLITRIVIGKEYRSFRSSLCNFLHSTVTPSLLGPNILLNTLFSNTLSLHSSLNVSDQDSHPYKTKGKIIVLLF